MTSISRPWRGPRVKQERPIWTRRVATIPRCGRVRANHRSGPHTTDPSPNRSPPEHEKENNHAHLHRHRPQRPHRQLRRQGVPLPAAHLGAANIIIVGADAGQLGTSTNVDHYYTPDIEQLNAVRNYEQQTLQTKQELINRYQVRIYGLSPFINPNLEGVPFIGANRINC